MNAYRERVCLNLHHLSLLFGNFHPACVTLTYRGYRSSLIMVTGPL